EMQFWRTAVRAFLAAIEGKDDELADLHHEMLLIARKTQHVHLIATSQMLIAYHRELRKNFADALASAEEALETSKQYNLPLWNPRAALKVMELQQLLGEKVEAQEIKKLIEFAKDQCQNELVHRAYRLLSQFDPSILPEWREHWEDWKNDI